MATIFFATGGYDPFPLPSGAEPLRLALREAVGGDIQVVSLTGGRKMVVNEHGAALGFRFNERATDVAGSVLIPGDFIKGDAILCAPSELELADAGESDAED